MQKLHPSLRTDLQYLHMIQSEVRKHDWLSMWTVFDHPSDYPDDYVARCFVIGKGLDGPRATHNSITGSLKHLRATMRAAGLTPLMRDEKDDPKIVETWL